MIFGWLALGLLLLTLGGEVLIRGASQIARRLGVSPLAIGLTVVAFGTSAPEMAVSALAAWNGNSEIAVANVVGSNIFNVLVVLGICAVIRPLVIAQQLVRRDVPIMIGISVGLLFLSMDGRLALSEGLLFVLGLIAFTFYTVLQSGHETRLVRDEYQATFKKSHRPSAIMRDIGLVAAGLTLLILGARWLIYAAVTIARMAGVSDTVIGLTIVAVGTSLPELVTSVIAILRGNRDIAVGNAIGSNIFNILGILGVSTLLSRGNLYIPAAVENFDLPVMTAVALACLPLFFTGHLLSRWEGALFLGYYAAYTLYLILAATQHDTLSAFSAVMLEYVLPITILSIAVVVARVARGRRGAQQ